MVSPSADSDLRGFGPDQIDPAAVYAWLGAVFGTLETVSPVRHYAPERFSENGSGQGGEALRPVSVTIRYHLDGSVVDVSTRRTYDNGESLLSHLRKTTVDYQLSAMGRLLPMAEVEQLIDLAATAETLDTRRVVVDGNAEEWLWTSTTWPEGKPLVSCGQRVSGSLIALVAPADLVDGLRVALQPRGV